MTERLVVFKQQEKCMNSSARNLAIIFHIWFLVRNFDLLPSLTLLHYLWSRDLYLIFFSFIRNWFTERCSFFMFKKKTRNKCTSMFTFLSSTPAPWQAVIAASFFPANYTWHNFLALWPFRPIKQLCVAGCVALITHIYTWSIPPPPRMQDQINTISVFYFVRISTRLINDYDSIHKCLKLSLSLVFQFQLSTTPHNSDDFCQIFTIVSMTTLSECAQTF